MSQPELVAETPVAANKKRVRERIPRSPYAFLLPMTIFVAALFVYPLVQMAVSTLVVQGPGGTTHLSFDPFVQFFAAGRTADLVARTLRIAIITTVATFILAFPITLWIRETGPRLRGFLIVLMLSPMLTSDVVRTLGWVTILGPHGLISGLFTAVGLTAPRILYTEGAVEIGLTQIFIGYMVLSLLSSVLRIPNDVISAAANLGANRVQILSRIILPQTIPGIVGGCAIVFPLAASTYVTASLLGGTSNPVLGTELYRQALTNFDFGSASAIGLTLFGIIILVVIIVGIVTRVANRKSSVA